MSLLLSLNKANMCCYLDSKLHTFDISTEQGVRTYVTLNLFRIWHNQLLISSLIEMATMNLC